MTIKALVFDAYGTLYDVHSVYTKTEELCLGKGDLITQIWRFREAIVLREMNNVSYQEIAQVAGVPIGTVMSRVPC
jgi:FMN phosphatase YigB (HAD superfamily)